MNRSVDINNHKLSLYDTLHRTSILVQFLVLLPLLVVVVVVVAVVVYHKEALYTHLSPVTTTSCYRAKLQETVKIHSPTNKLNFFNILHASHLNKNHEIRLSSLDINS